LIIGLEVSHPTKFKLGFNQAHTANKQRGMLQCLDLTSKIIENDLNGGTIVVGYKLDLETQF